MVNNICLFYSRLLYFIFQSVHVDSDSVFQSVDTESDRLGIRYCSLIITVQSVDAEADSLGLNIVV